MCSRGRQDKFLIGSSRQYGTEDTRTETHMLEAMLRRAIEYMPGLQKLSAIRSWTGFRAATPDKLPLIGLCPGYRSVYLATGHEGLGITTSLATARLLADQVLGTRISHSAPAIFAGEESRTACLSWFASPSTNVRSPYSTGRQWPWGYSLLVSFFFGTQLRANRADPSAAWASALNAAS